MELQALLSISITLLKWDFSLRHISQIQGIPSEWPQFLCSRSRFTNNNNEQNATKFTIGTSDEEDSNDDEVARDLEKLFCPLTENNGAQHDIDLGYQGIY